MPGFFMNILNFASFSPIFVVEKAPVFRPFEEVATLGYVLLLRILLILPSSAHWITSSGLRPPSRAFSKIQRFSKWIKFEGFLEDIQIWPAEFSLGAVKNV